MIILKQDIDKAGGGSLKSSSNLNFFLNFFKTNGNELVTLVLRYGIILTGGLDLISH